MLSDWMGMGDWRLLFINRDRVRAVTVADVQRVWAQYFRASNRTVGLYYPSKTPERAEIPPTPDVAALVQDYKGDAKREEGEVFEATPANIEARITRKKLANGFELVLLPKKTRGGTVFAGLALRYGEEKSLANWGEAPQFATNMLMRGSKKHTRQQISDELDRLKARVNMNTWGSGTYVSLETTRDNLPALLALVTEILREPAFDASEFEQLRTEVLAGYEQQRKEPSAVAFNAYQRHLNPYPAGDIRHTETTEETIAGLRAVKREDAMRFHREFFGAQSGQIAVVGDFDAAALESELTEALGGWTAPKPYKRVDNKYQAVGAKSATFETPDKAQAFFVAGLNLQLRDDDPDYAALTLGNYMLGGGFLNSRLMARIRGKDGLSYGTGSQLSADSFEQAGAFLAYAIYAPQNLAKLEQAFHEEIARVLNEDFTAEEIAAAKSGWLQSRMVSRAQDNELSGVLSHYSFLGRTLAWDAELEKKIQALDGAQIRAALRKHIKPENFTIIRAGDFANVTGTAR
jgi:zinc protease